MARWSLVLVSCLSSCPQRVCFGQDDRPEMMPVRDCLRAFLEIVIAWTRPPIHSTAKPGQPCQMPRDIMLHDFCSGSQFALTFFGDYLGYNQLRPPVEQVVFQGGGPFFRQADLFDEGAAVQHQYFVRYHFRWSVNVHRCAPCFARLVVILTQDFHRT